MDIPCCIHDICLVYVCAYTPRSIFNIVYSCVHTLSHDYTTALTIYGYVCAHIPRTHLRTIVNIVYSVHRRVHYMHTHVTNIHCVQPIRGWNPGHVTNIHCVQPIRDRDLGHVITQLDN